MNKPSILIADDVELNIEILSDIFEDEYCIYSASDGNAAMDIIHKMNNELAALLLDVYMPEFSGIDVLKAMNRDNMLNKIPVLMITSDGSQQIENTCLDLGAVDFIKKPFTPSIVKARVRNAVNLYTYKNHLEEKVAAQTLRIKYNNHRIVELMGNLVESRNLESGEHVQRVAAYSKQIATRLMHRYPEYGLTKKTIDVIAEAAVLHDVGKIAIPDAILLKPGKLTDEEFDTMKKHTTLGGAFVKKMNGIWDDEYSKAVYEITMYHHERYDGRGYPEGLAGDDIPISAQIVSVADVYDALIHERCYKAALPKKTACDMILGGQCGTISPKILDCFEECFPFENIE